ncbi:MAG: hypothetical protein U9Q22_04450 [Candidatus Altiarchaeota archaeon]|nr:hypothetical protein [Candidatus Altiarchaeota archaeon]
MGTIAVDVDDGIERKFRKIASITYHKKKGYLGRSITEAMKYWIYVNVAEAEPQTRVGD